MAIEFNCPYCTAAIRVPDAYAGKQGRCPKCDTRLLIPSVPVPGQPVGQEHLAAGPQPSGVPDGSSTVPAAPGQASNEFGQNVTGANDSSDIRPLTPIIKSQRRSARRRPSRTLVIGVPVICFLVLFGIIAYSLMEGLPQLRGELIGRRLESQTLPQSTIPWSDVSLNDDDRKILQDALTTQPETLMSQFIGCRLSASDDGIIVTLSAQPESQWIVVDVRGEKPLAIWRRKQGPQLNRLRLDELRANVKLYASDKLLKISGEQIAIDAVAVRDKLALNSCRLPLSYAIQAITDMAVFPCASEDEFGQLYFCLPKTVQSFLIQGRILADGSSGFHGDYTVDISEETVITNLKAADGESQADASLQESEYEMPDEKPEIFELEKEM